MDEKPEEQDPEKIELTYMGNPPPEAGDDIYSYKNMMLTNPSGQGQVQAGKWWEAG